MVHLDKFEEIKDAFMYRDEAHELGDRIFTWDHTFITDTYLLRFTQWKKLYESDGQTAKFGCIIPITREKLDETDVDDILYSADVALKSFISRGIPIAQGTAYPFVSLLKRK